MGEETSKGVYLKMKLYHIFRPIYIPIIRKTENTRLYRLLYANREIKKWSVKNTHIFTYIEIETLNRCNGKCSFCPINATAPQRQYAKMDEQVFKKIIDELSEMGFDRKVALFSNNEPFLDERIIDFAKYARNKLPKAYLFLYSNGTVLTMEKFTGILPYINELVIDNYNDEMEWIPNVQKIWDYCQKHPELRGKVIFYKRLENQVLLSRGGQAPNRSAFSHNRFWKCGRPFNQVIIRPDGKLSLCCSDPMGVYTMGDVSKNTLKEIWFSDKYQRIRSQIQKNGGAGMKLCKNCDDWSGKLDVKIVPEQW